MTNVRSHPKRSKRGRRFTVRSHTRAGKARAVERMTKMHEDITRKKAAHLFDMVNQSIAQDIKSEGRVAIKDFGTFRVKKIPAKKGGKRVFMPMLGKEITTKSKPASQRIKFIPSKYLRGMI